MEKSPASGAAAAPPPPLRVTVVVAAYTEERWDQILLAASALDKQTRRPDEVVLVIDHNEALRERLTREFADLQVVPNVYKRGLSGARNSGVDAGTGDIFVFIDDDAWPEPECLERLVAAFADPAVHVVGGAALAVWPTTRPSWFPEELDWIVGCSYTGLPESAAFVRNPIGACMAIRREVFAMVGQFSGAVDRVGAVPIGCEETELCIRLRLHSPEALVYYEPTAIVRHRVSAERARFRYLAQRSWGEGISKGRMSRLVGQGESLDSEKAYLRRILPGAMRRDVASGNLPRAAAVASSVALAGAAYVGTRLQTSPPGLRVKEYARVRYQPVHPEYTDTRS